MDELLKEFKIENTKFSIHKSKNSNVSVYLLVRNAEIEDYLVEELGFQFQEDMSYFKSFPTFVDEQMKDTFVKNLEVLLETYNCD